MPLHEDVNGIRYQNFLLKSGWWMTPKLGGFKWIHAFLTIAKGKGGWDARALWTLHHLGVKSQFLSCVVFTLVMIMTAVS